MYFVAEEERDPVVIANPTHRDVVRKQIKLITQPKKYNLVFDKRVLDRETKSSYPYGYLWNKEDADNVELFCDLLSDS